MRVECWFDNNSATLRNRNKLLISSDDVYKNCVKVSILNIEGKTTIEETVVDGYELIKAIQNAMNN